MKKNQLEKSRIMIDGRNLKLDQGTGVSTYARNLSYLLHDLGYEVDILYDQNVSYGINDLLKEIAFFDSTQEPPIFLMLLWKYFNELARGPYSHKAIKIPLTEKIIKDTFKSKLPYFDRIYNSKEIYRKIDAWNNWFIRLHNVSIDSRPDIVHWTYPLALRIKSIPNIYTLHDLVPLRLPYTTLDKKRKYFKLLEKITKKADHIVTVSESSKRDIIDFFGVEENRITNTYQSVRIPEKYANKSIQTVEMEISGTFGLHYKDYYLFWGAIEPKKNIGRIIEAYLASKVSAPLVIVGNRAWKHEDELKLLYDDNIRSLINVGKEIRTKNKIIQLNYVTFSLLVSLIKGAKATLFTSLYEGFGLPVLESMTLGTPVISSKTASIPEIAGKAAILVDPYDTNQITQAIIKMDQDADLRYALKSKGLRQAEKFSETLYKKKLNLVYQRFI